MSRLRSFARENRRNPTEPEVRLWRHRSNSQLDDFKFRRQYRIGFRILDFFCPSVALGVEIDGHTHDAELDRAADAMLAQQGVLVIRLSNTDVMQNIDGALMDILATARALPPRWPSHWATPHPNPSPEGEGL